MTVDIEDTIAAIASANGNALRGIVRMTGPDTIACLNQLFQIEVARDHPTQVETCLRLDDDVELPGHLLVWPTRSSYTRQPSAEFHTFGTPPLLELVLKKFCESGCRIARPGEFTLRAFLGGRLDLTQAEAVLAVIDSTHRQQFDVALRQLAGGLAGPLSEIREQLIDLLAELEAGLDFVEEDIEFVSQEQLIASIQESLISVNELAGQMHSRASAESSYRVALVGWPNVGKSSLFNAMLKVDRAIVADVAGTTRDYISGDVEKGGLQIQLIDTAGLDSVLMDGMDAKKLLGSLTQSQGAIDSVAQEASIQQLRSADIKLLCLDSNRTMNEFERKLFSLLDLKSTIVVLTKCDLDRQIQFTGEYHLTSAIPGQVAGMEGLWDEICDRLAGSDLGDATVVGSTLSRCREHLGEVQQGLEAARDAALASSGEEIIAAELRYSLEQLGHIVGTVYTDDILDRIFGRFCIGK